MIDVFLDLFIFSAKVFIVAILILFLLAGIILIFSRGKEKFTGKISIKNLNENFAETKETLLHTILSKKDFKNFTKEKRNIAKKNLEKKNNNIFVINFEGDIKASAVASLREEITAALSVAKPTDEILVKIESGGGLVHSYGLAAAQLERVRNAKIPLIVCVDKVAASGGYLMASVADKIIAAPFAILGSIGVLVQLPNFNRLLKEKHIDFEQLTAGSFKRTLTMFGHNTEDGREKLQEEINEIQKLFKELIVTYRQQVDIEKVATGENWLGKKAIELKLIDKISTSDDYLISQSKDNNLYEIKYQMKKSIGTKLANAISSIKYNLSSKQIHIPY